MKNYILLFILFGTLSSCKRAKSTAAGFSKNDFNSFLAEQKLVNYTYKRILIIPGVGCGGCISDAEVFYIKNYKDPSNLYVFTGISDMKIFKNKLPDDAFKYKNIAIDSTNFLSEHGFKSIYPSEIETSDADTLKLKIFNH